MTERLDWLGGVLYAPALALLLWALSRIKAHGLSDATTLAAFGAGVLLLAVWLRLEWRHPAPMIDVRRIAQRDVGLPMALMFLFGLGTAQLMLILMSLAQQPLWTGVGLGLSATVAGLVKLPSNFMGLFGAPWGGHLAARRGARSAATLGSLLILLGWCGLTCWHQAIWLLALWAMVIALGGAMMMSAVPEPAGGSGSAGAHQRIRRPVAGGAHAGHSHRHADRQRAAGHATDSKRRPTWRRVPE